MLSEREDLFLNFAQHFEVRLHLVLFSKFVSGESTYLDSVQDVRNKSFEEQRRQATEKCREELEEKKKILWYKLPESLDKKSVLFLRPHNRDDTRDEMYSINGSKNVLRDLSYVKFYQI